MLRPSCDPENMIERYIVSLYLARAILTCDNPDSARVSTLANFRVKHGRNFPKTISKLRETRVRKMVHATEISFFTKYTDKSLNPFFVCCCFFVTNPHVKQFFFFLWSLRFHFEIIIIFYFFSIFFFRSWAETTFTKITSFSHSRAYSTIWGKWLLSLIKFL